MIGINPRFSSPSQILTDLQGRSNDVYASQVISNYYASNSYGKNDDFFLFPFFQVVVMNSKVMKLEGFSYDGRGGDVYFWVGVGPQPSSKGHKVIIYTHNDFF